MASKTREPRTRPTTARETARTSQRCLPREGEGDPPRGDSAGGEAGLRSANSTSVTRSHRLWQYARRGHSRVETADHPTARAAPNLFVSRERHGARNPTEDPP